jgi:hypothetical protein
MPSLREKTSNIWPKQNLLRIIPSILYRHGGGTKMGIFLACVYLNLPYVKGNSLKGKNTNGYQKYSMYSL